MDFERLNGDIKDMRRRNRGLDGHIKGPGIRPDGDQTSFSRRRCCITAERQASMPSSAEFRRTSGAWGGS